MRFAIANRFSDRVRPRPLRHSVRHDHPFPPRQGEPCRIAREPYSASNQWRQIEQTIRTIDATPSTAIASIGGGWEGQAAEATANGLTPLGVWATAGAEDARVLARLLMLLARPDAQLELRAWFGRSVRAVAAGRLDSAVLAVRQDATITLEACGSLPAGLLTALPAAGPGPGRSSTLPTHVLGEALANPAELRQVLIARNVPPVEAGLLARMLATAGGRSQLTALATDRWGVARRLSRVLTVLDGPRGRYLLTRSTAEDGTDWTTVGPTDDRRLRHRVDELLDDAVAAAGRSA
nr:ESX secretion-associated protein EspG [Pseudonocardia acidicola]